MGEVGEMMSGMDSDGSGDGDGDSGDVPVEFVFFGIAMLMLGLSPFIFILSAVISSILLASGKSAKVMGILHLLYTVNPTNALKVFFIYITARHFSLSAKFTSTMQNSPIIKN